MGRRKFAREDMEEDGRIDDRVQISRLMALQLIKSFEQNYDEGTIEMIEALRERSNSPKAAEIVHEYDEYYELVEELRERYGL